MNESSLHVTFSSSGGGTLRVALAKAGRKGEVISLMDCLNSGPIDSSNLKERELWAEKELGIRDDWGMFEDSRMFWDKVLSDNRSKILWTSRRSAMEYCGFLECLWRLDDEPCSVVDMTEVKVRYLGSNGEIGPPLLAICLPVLSEHDILNNGILDMAEPLSSEGRRHYRAVWQQLRAENAAFRVVGPEGIVSAPITYFDNQVLACVTPEWQKSARVVGEVMGKEDFYYIQTGDLVYFSRLQKLVESDLVESRGDMSIMRGSEVRLPPSEST